METNYWAQFLAAFLAGGVLTNAIPHLTHGLSGDRFPTPFSKPHGKGLSSPMLNTLWACFNLLVGYFLLRAGNVSFNNKALLLAFFLGLLAISIVSSVNFAKKDIE